MSKGQQATKADPAKSGRFYCHTCQRRFIDANALRMHIQSSKKHQQRKSAPSASAPNANRSSVPATTQVHMCTLCNKGFKDKAALRKHKKDSPKHAKVSGGLRETSSSTTRVPVLSLNYGNLTEIGGDSNEPGEEYEATDDDTKEALWSLQNMLLNEPYTSFARGNPDIWTALANSFPAAGSGYDYKEGLSVSPFHTDPVDTDDYATVARLSPAPQGEDAIPQITKVNPEIPAPWSSIPVSERGAVLGALQAQSHSIDCLATEHYWTERPSATDIDMTSKCNNCGAAKRSSDATESVCCFHPAKKPFERGIIRGRGTRIPRTARCVNCLKLGPSGGCIVLPTHDFAAPDAKLSEMAPAPGYNPNARQAVVLDCEMVGVLGANHRESSEVVRVSAVDFLSGEVLLDTYVSPQGQVISWRTKFSGVNASILRAKKREGKVVDGWRAARDLLWRVIDTRTVLIGHSLNNDLGVLGMVHTRIVDSAIMTRLAVGEDCQRHWALKILVKQFLDRDIQTGNHGHDCLEDTFAAREVVLWCLRSPSELQAWAAEERKIMAEKKRAKKACAAEDMAAKPPGI
ncbi:hypothetical protein ASPCAL07138 [Aspergillus calidoustus]|uniref:C2H2-type domain-containing protein n=2 Tax=Aspergillus calidoustus TaxID=454130 RepID=A0A0U5CA13_ASPCI|nr:hypothetical protein ASPCAL07138 [Aspergillus calidoustus]